MACGESLALAQRIPIILAGLDAIRRVCPARREYSRSRGPKPALEAQRPPLVNEKRACLLTRVSNLNGARFRGHRQTRAIEPCQENIGPWHKHLPEPAMLRGWHCC